MFVGLSLFGRTCFGLEDELGALFGQQGYYVHEGCMKVYGYDSVDARAIVNPYDITDRKRHEAISKVAYLYWQRADAGEINNWLKAESNIDLILEALKY